jgi:HNH endonuclease
MNPLRSAWEELHRLGKHAYEITKCQDKCVEYATYPRKTVHGKGMSRHIFFTEVQPEGPWNCDECGAERRKNEVVVDHIDHIHNEFGSHNCPENLRALCGSCNSKFARTEQSKLRMSQSQKEFFASPEGKSQAKKNSERMKGITPPHWALPDARENFKAKVRQWREDNPEDAAVRDENMSKTKRRIAGYHGRMHKAMNVIDPDCCYCKLTNEYKLLMAQETECG